MSSSASRAWIVAASIGAVEALKDQGICRWNYALRSVHQHVKNNVKSISATNKLSSPASAAVSNKLKEAKAKQSEESLRTVMYLSCWGPNSKRPQLSSNTQLSFVSYIAKPCALDACIISTGIKVLSTRISGHPPKTKNTTGVTKMSSTSRAWVIAASVGAVEALKDQGICRWNYTLRSIHQHAREQVRLISQAKRLPSQSSAMVSNKLKEEKARKSEESLRKVMYLSCWGPN
ncbi:uncharacterized protein LOC120000071 [Tripterygium wilfordii]|uniref:uncharacterized protein LOC120000071 n=1 Tax=Tripterygium wilfordii TaxID=458696 RepID=UPI0018F844AB|nr:uncharacterized protein LOC120000071 [Tripterygium wilfordii]